MAVTISHLTSGVDSDSGTSSTTASISPTANRLILVAISQRTGITENPNEPTLSGNGLTWVKIRSIITDSSGSSRRRLSLFRSLGASPSSGAITIDCGGQSNSGVIWIVDEFAGVDTSGTNGSGAVVQSGEVIDESITTGDISVTLAAFGNVNNATYGCFNSADGAHTFTEGTGFSLIDTVNATDDVNSGGCLVAEWKNSNDTSVDGTFSGAIQGGGIAIEIKEAVAAGGTVATGFMTTNTQFWG